MRLPALFSDNMVVQHGRPLPIWGWSVPEDSVTVTLAGKVAHAKADHFGKWHVELPAIDAGGPYELKVSGRESRAVSNILAGEVWICSGQSNMEWPLELSDNPQEEIAAANYPRIRLFTVPRRPSDAPESDVTGSWSPCDPESAARFSAVGYFFGRKLQQELNVPIGLINTSWGGTRAEAWTSIEGLCAEPALKVVVDELQASLGGSVEERHRRYAQIRAAWYSKLPDGEAKRSLSTGWERPEFNDNSWKTMRLPNYWQQMGHQTNGVFWFRTTAEIPASWEGQDLQLSLGAVDKTDDTYFNGQRVGGVSWADEPYSWCTGRVYTVPKALVKAGRVVIAVRVLSNFTGGGIVGPGSDMNIRRMGTTSADALPLSGEWRYSIEQDFGPINTPPEPPPPLDANTATALYNGMINPLIPFAIRGAIWYQGESNAGDSKRYAVLFPRMIKDWREHWMQGDFPFYFVQLANFGSTDPLAKGNWAGLRDAQDRTRALAQTGMAVTIDIGNPTDIHPRNKQDVGLRLALNALALTYNKDVEFRGPSYRGLKIEGPYVRISFEHADGLHAKGALSGFIIAGSDRKFVVANAVIEHDHVVVTHPDITAPAAVRYGWSDSPTCTLYNGAKLPAEPFRTDNWEE